MFVAARKFARIPIVVTCCAITLLGGIVAGGIIPSILIAFAAVILLLIHGNATNDLADYEIDKVNLKKASDRPLVSGDVTKVQVWWIQGVAGLGALGLSLLLGTVPFFVSLAVFLYSYLYSFRPLRITDRVLLSPLTLPATYAYQPFTLGVWAGAHSIDYPWLLATALYLGFIARILLKDFRDVKGDKLFGKQTFLLQFGVAATCVASGIVATSSFVLMILATKASPGLLVALSVSHFFALQALAKLSKQKKLNDQVRTISMIGKIGNASILALFAYYLCIIYVPNELWAVQLLPIIATAGALLLVRKRYVSRV